MARMPIPEVALAITLAPLPIVTPIGLPCIEPPPALPMLIAAIAGESAPMAATTLPG